MRRLLAVVLCLTLLPMTGCSAFGPKTAGAAWRPAKGDAERSVDPRVAAANNEFGFRLLKKLPADRNALLSPFSVSVSLAMTANGATGETRKAMERTLGLDALGMDAANKAYADLLARLETHEPSSTLAVADSLWVAERFPIEESFLRTNRDYFAAETTSADLRDPTSTDRINEWVSQRTEKMIPKLFEQPLSSPNTALVLVNALYFKADWAERFDKAGTRDRPFHLAPKEAVSVPMMSQTADLGYLKTDGFEAVRMPYEDGKRAMYVFVPEKVDGLDGFLASLDANAWDGWMRGFEKREVRVVLPRMKVRSNTSLKKQLRELGMGPAFEGGFDAMAPDAGLFIDDVFQAVAVDVDERGTEAAAGTGVVTRWKSGGGGVVTANRPFFFAIRDEASGVVLFAGAVRDPRGE